MNYWRMSMRWGNGGEDFFPQCCRRGIAALGYYCGASQEPVVADCRRITPAEFERAWRERAPHRPSPRASMRALAYEVRRGDIIYARSAPYIVARGEVTAEYDYDPNILDGTGCRWEHFVRADWAHLPRFKVSILPNPPALLKLEGDNLTMMLSAEGEAIEASVRRDLDLLRIEEAYVEGQTTTRLVNHFERNPQLRTAAVAFHGTRCRVCGLSFGDVYGELGDGFIEVHHLTPVASYSGEVSVDPRSDMTVVCSNCHRMLHRRSETPLTVEELGAVLSKR